MIHKYIDKTYISLFIPVMVGLATIMISVTIVKFVIANPNHGPVFFLKILRTKSMQHKKVVTTSKWIGFLGKRNKWKEIFDVMSLYDIVTKSGYTTIYKYPKMYNKFSFVLSTWQSDPWKTTNIMFINIGKYKYVPYRFKFGKCLSGWMLYEWTFFVNIDKLKLRKLSLMSKRWGSIHQAASINHQLTGKGCGEIENDWILYNTSISSLFLIHFTVFLAVMTLITF